MSSLERVRTLVRARRLPLGPPLSERAVAEFEARHRISLPGDYRDFLLHVGDGGPGPPSYGLLPLGETSATSVPPWFTSGYSDYLSQPFPLTTHWVWEDEDPSPALDTLVESLRQGNLCLGTDGCGLYWLLIISGPESGQVWSLADVGAQPLAPRLSFLPWYEYWLGGGDDWFRDFAD